MANQIKWNLWLLKMRNPTHRRWGAKLLPRFKDINGKRYQLHATKGWRCVGKTEG